MMSRSFREADHQKKMVDKQNELLEVEKEIRDLCTQELSSYLQPLVKFYNCASSYLDARKKCLVTYYQLLYFFFLILLNP